MNLTAISELEAAVTSGAGYLDGRYAGWRWRVDPDAIEAACPVHSVTGQLFGPDLVDQFRAVGLTDDTRPADERVFAFAAMGFAVMINSPVTVTPELRASMISLADTLSPLLAGTGVAINIDDLPSVVPVPRDPDVVLMEAEGLTDLWRREVLKR